MDKRAVSPDSSTQITEKRKKDKKRKSKSRGKRKRNQLKPSSSSQDLDSDSSMSDSKRSKNSSESVKHLSEFLHHREGLHLQLFTIVPKKEVKGMIPDALKDLSFREVRRLCSEQLQMLSERQIESIIEGKGLDSFEDETDDEPEKTDGTETQRQAEKGLWRKQGRIHDVKGKEIKSGEGNEKKESDLFIFQEMVTIPKQEEIDELVEGTSVAKEEAPDNIQSGDASLDTEAELKELEFRARALQSLVHARQRQMNFDHP